MSDNTAEPLRIRDATPHDAPTIIAFNRRLATETENKTLDHDVVSLGVRRALDSPQYCRYFLAERDGRIVGQTMVTYEWSDWRNGVFWWIQSVYVVEDERGRGVFRSLYEHVQTTARALPDVCGLRLYVEEHNTAAIATYRRLGMIPSGHLVSEHDWSGATGAPDRQH